MAIMTSSAQTTVYEPSATDPRVAAALTVQKRLQDVMQAHDVPGIEALMAPDLLVNAPINKVANRENVIGRIKTGQIAYEPNVVRNIEFAGVRGDVVVIMGEEVVHPNKDAPYAGKTEHRRFTDVWKQMDGVWKLWIRQATVTKAD
jgi:ketosteroid isomerase-like protein